jgi:hypothetical protein
VNQPTIISCRAASFAGIVLLAISLVVCSQPDAFAQSSATQGGAESSGQRSEPSDTVIISKMPERRGPIYALLKKLFCKNDGSVKQGNETLRNSGLGNIRLRLVHTEVVDYDETEGEHFDHLYRMVDGIGPFKSIRNLRNDKKADIVGLILDDASGCGLSTRVGADAEEAYFVVHHSCASITISIAHEIGHILGARHDRSIDTNNAPFAYGHGHVNGKWRDIMSYQQGCDGCLRIPYWSNPRVTYKGEPTGTLSEDNARVILEQAERVSRFR